MSPANEIRSYLCLCSSCSKLTHLRDGVKVPGLQVSPGVHRSHQLNDQRLHILQALDEILEDSNSSSGSNLSEEEDLPLPPATSPDVGQFAEGSRASQLNQLPNTQTAQEFEGQGEVTIVDPSEHL
ncbi:hypothetical protein DFH28DRAFT_925887 [Melampsora americana]|nr:hypothetical protein DFH28DRAFT_934939 [Melampsora americana]KAH9818402.1 hypothetical protein DFH28DRAFT_925887 [Melampsora americana]